MTKFVFLFLAGFISLSSYAGVYKTEILLVAEPDCGGKFVMPAEKYYRDHDFCVILYRDLKYGKTTYSIAPREMPWNVEGYEVEFYNGVVSQFKSKREGSKKYEFVLGKLYTIENGMRVEVPR